MCQSAWLGRLPFWAESCQSLGWPPRAREEVTQVTKPKEAQKRSCKARVAVAIGQFKWSAYYSLMKSHVANLDFRWLKNFKASRFRGLKELFKSPRPKMISNFNDNSEACTHWLAPSQCKQNATREFSLASSALAKLHCSSCSLDIDQDLTSNGIAW